MDSKKNDCLKFLKLLNRAFSRFPRELFVWHVGSHRTIPERSLLLHHRAKELVSARRELLMNRRLTPQRFPKRVQRLRHVGRDLPLCVHHPATQLFQFVRFRAQEGRVGYRTEHGGRLLVEAFVSAVQEQIVV